MRPWRKDPNTVKIYTITLSSCFFLSGLRPFTRLPVYWGRGSNQPFWGQLNPVSQLTLIPGNAEVTVALQAEWGFREARYQ